MGIVGTAGRSRRRPSLSWPSPSWPSSSWRGAAGIAVVVLLTVVGCYVEANPAHSYGGLHLTGHPPLAALRYKEFRLI